MFQEIKDGNLEKVKELLDKGAKIELIHLQTACDNNNFKIVKLLLDKAPKIINEKDYDGDTILSNVCGNSQIQKKIVELLLDKGAKLEEKNKYGSTPLITSIYNNNKKITELLLDKGANIDATDKYGNTLLLYYCSVSSRTIINIEKVEFLLDKGANIEARDKYGNTPLLLACNNTKKNSEKLVKLLSEKGANMEVKNKNKDNVLTLAHNNINRSVLPEVMENYYVKYLENNPEPEKNVFFDVFLKILDVEKNSVLFKDMNSKYKKFFDDYVNISKTDAHYTIPTAIKKKPLTSIFTFRKPPIASPIHIATEVFRDPETEGFDVSDPDEIGERYQKQYGGKKKSIKRKTKKNRRKTSKK